MYRAARKGWAEGARERLLARCLDRAEAARRRADHWAHMTWAMAAKLLIHWSDVDRDWVRNNCIRPLNALLEGCLDGSLKQTA